MRFDSPRGESSRPVVIVRTRSGLTTDLSLAAASRSVMVERGKPSAPSAGGFGGAMPWLVPFYSASVALCRSSHSRSADVPSAPTRHRMQFVPRHDDLPCATSRRARPGKAGSHPGPAVNVSTSARARRHPALPRARRLD